MAILNHGTRSDVVTYFRKGGGQKREFRGDDDAPDPPDPPDLPADLLPPYDSPPHLASVLFTRKGADAFDKVSKLSDAEIDEMRRMRTVDMGDAAIIKRMYAARPLHAAISRTPPEPTLTSHTPTPTLFVPPSPPPRSETTCAKRISTEMTLASPSPTSGGSLTACSGRGSHATRRCDAALLTPHPSPPHPA